MRYLMTILIILSFSAYGFSATIIVPDNYPAIQQAIDATVNGDTVLVRAGTYLEQIDFKGKAITVTSQKGADLTIIDGDKMPNGVVTFDKGEGPDSIIEGFTITNGSSIIPGAGIRCEYTSPTIRSNVISKNLTFYGGGIYCGYASPTIEDNSILDNEAHFGAGITCMYSSPQILNNRIEGNWNIPETMWDSDGAGIFCRNSSPLICGNLIADNKAEAGSYEFAFGGGIYCEENSAPAIRNNLIKGNYASSDGGGIYCCSDTNPSIISNTIVGNTSGWCGGGISTRSPSIIADSIVVGNHAEECGGGIQSYRASIVNTIVSGNTADQWGGGISCNPIVDPVLLILNCTIFGNSAAMMYGGISNVSDKKAIVTNTIVWGNMPDQLDPRLSSTVTYCDVQGGWPGAGNLDADPLLLDPFNGDFHLTFASPCKDSGDNLAAGLPYEDFEGDPRIAYGTVDMGADEFYTHLYWTGDATPGGNVELKFVGLPGTAPVQLWLGSGVLDPPWPTKYGDWHLQFPLLASIPNLGAIPSSGVNLLPFTFPPDTPTALSLPFQAGIGQELSNLSVMEVE